jgi:hypothetical protein
MGEAKAFEISLRPFEFPAQKAFAWVIAGLFCMSMALGTAKADPLSADVHGVTVNALGAPIPKAQISLHSVEDNTTRTIVSDNFGTFVVENLKPGHYQLSAAKGALASASAISVSLGARQDLRVDMTLLPAASTEIPSNSNLTADSHTPAATVNPSEAPLTDREKILLDRLDRLEQRLEAMEAKGSTTAAPAQPTTAAVQPKTNPTPVAVAQPAPAAPKAAPVASNPVVASLDGSAAVKTDQETKEAANSFPITSSRETAKAATVIATPSAPPQAAAPAKPAKIDPFSDWDWTWLNGNPRTKDIYWDSKFFTPEIRSDVTATWDNQHPADHSMGGSSELFREGEVQLEQLGIGGDFHYDNVRARFMTQFGAYSTATIRNDGSYASGEWDLANANRYLSEAYGGYHFNWLNGVNIDAGIFMSYIGLFSYYNFDNWAYQPSYVSSNTPWFFQGVRLQIFPTAHLKIEPWYINGWQSYASANNRPGLGGQIKWTPKPWLNFISNNYGLGHDDLFAPGRTRLHTDNSQEILYYSRPKSQYLSKMASSFTEDIGCEFGGGVSCTGDHAGGPKQSFIGAMIYNRFWFDRDQFGVTIGGGRINNPGRYLVLLPPINGETATSAAINSPYFTENPGDQFKAWDTSLTLDWMPKQYITFRIEPDYRHASVPYWTGRGGITPPAGLGESLLTPNGFPSEYACNDGTPTASMTGCGNDGGLWYPNLVKTEFLIDFDIMVKF